MKPLKLVTFRLGFIYGLVPTIATRPGLDASRDRCRWWVARCLDVA